MFQTHLTDQGSCGGLPHPWWAREQGSLKPWSIIFPSELTKPRCYTGKQHKATAMYYVCTESRVTDWALDGICFTPGGLEAPALWFLYQFFSQCSSLLAQLCSPCCPITVFRECGRYLSTHSRLPSSPVVSGAGSGEGEEARPRSLRATWPARRPAGVPLSPDFLLRPCASSVFDGLGVWGDLEFPLEGEIFWALGVPFWLGGVLVFEALHYLTESKQIAQNRSLKINH